MSSPPTPFRLLALAACIAAMVLPGCEGEAAQERRHMQKGREFMEAGNFEKARLEFRNALQIAPADSEVRYENGLADAKLGNLVEAAQFYNAAIEANPDNVAARAGLGRLYLYGGAPERAIDSLGDALDRHPDDVPMLVIRAGSRNLLKDPAGALADAERAARLAPDDEDAIALLAGIYQGQGHPDKALTLVDEAVRRLPGNVDLQLTLAQLCANAGQETRAEQILANIVKLKPDVAAHYLRLANYYAGKERLDDAERVLRDAIRALPTEHGLYVVLINFLAAHRGRDVAERELNGAIAADPQNVELKFEKAHLAEEARQYADAEAIYRQIIADPLQAGPAITAGDRLAELLVQRKDLAGALKVVSDVLAKNPRDDDALILRGNLALERKDPKTAIADLRAALRDQPNAVGVMRSLARAHLANGEPGLAEEILRRAMEANPKDAAVQVELARLLTDIGRPAQAKLLINDLVKSQPDNIDAVDIQFRISVALQDFVTAKAAADALVALQPNSGVGYFYQGVLAEENKRHEEALALFSRSLELQPDAVDPLRAVVGTLIEMKRTPEALKRLDDAIARYPKDGVALTIKGDIYLNEQRGAEAAAAFRAALERDPTLWLTYRNLAAAQLMLHDEAAALATLKLGIGKVADPENLEGELAALYETLKRPDEAIGVFEAAVRRSPRSDFAANRLAMLLVAYRHDPADLTRARDLVAGFATSTNPDFLDTYGWVAYKRGEGPAAVAALRTALSKVPESPLILYHLGMAQTLAGQLDEARESLAHALKSGRSFPGMDEARATLDHLQAKAAAPTPAALPASKK